MRRYILLFSPFLAGLILVGAQSAFAAPTSRGVSAASLKSLGLSTADVTHVFGSGFLGGVGHSSKNTSDPAKCTKKNTIDQYLVTFSRKTTFVVFSTLSAFKDSGTVQCELNYGLKHPLKQAGFTQHTSPLSGIGDRAFLELATYHSGKIRNNITSIAFSRGKYGAAVGVESPTSIRTSDVTTLAHIVDGRISSNG
jgi:hypothetical protein